MDIYAAIKNEQSQDGETKLSGKAISDTLLQTVGKESENWVWTYDRVLDKVMMAQQHCPVSEWEELHELKKLRLMHILSLLHALPKFKCVKGRYYTCFMPRSRHSSGGVQLL